MTRSSSPERRAPRHCSSTARKRVHHVERQRVPDVPPVNQAARLPLRAPPPTIRELPALTVSTGQGRGHAAALTGKSNKLKVLQLLQCQGSDDDASASELHRFQNVSGKPASLRPSIPKGAYHVLELRIFPPGMDAMSSTIFSVTLGSRPSVCPFFSRMISATIWPSLQSGNW